MLNKYVQVEKVEAKEEIKVDTKDIADPTKPTNEPKPPPTPPVGPEGTPSSSETIDDLMNDVPDDETRSVTTFDPVPTTTTKKQFYLGEEKEYKSYKALRSKLRPSVIFDYQSLANSKYRAYSKMIGADHMSVARYVKQQR